MPLGISLDVAVAAVGKAGGERRGWAGSEEEEAGPQQVTMACPEEGHKLFPVIAGGSRVCEEELEAPQCPGGSGVMVASILRMTLEKPIPCCVVQEYGPCPWAWEEALALSSMEKSGAALGL